MRRPPAAVSLIFALIFLNAFTWLGLALLIASGRHPGIPSDVTVRAVMAILFTAAALPAWDFMRCYTGALRWVTGLR